MNNARRFAEFIESFSGRLSSELELVSHFHHFIAMYPYCQGSAGGIVILCFADAAERPVDLKRSHPLVRGLLNLRTSRGGHSYHW